MRNELLRILVIEDDPAFRAALTVRIKNVLPNVRLVDSFETAEEGEEMLLNGIRYDAIILDFHLPGINGAELVGKIRELDADVAILCMSSIEDYRVVQNFLRMGADNFVNKIELLKKSVLERELQFVMEKSCQRKSDKELQRTEIQLEAIETLIHTVHHEINNPLAIVNLAVEVMVRREVGSEERQKLLGMIQQGAHRIADVIRKLNYIRPASHQNSLQGPITYSVLNL
ncbi:MAG: response regulator [bacterium]